MVQKKTDAVTVLFFIFVIGVLTTTASAFI